MNQSITTLNLPSTDLFNGESNTLNREVSTTNFDSPATTGLQSLHLPLQSVTLPWINDWQPDEIVQPAWHTTTGKRALDIVASLLVIAFILSWLIPILGILIRKESSGPMLFVQRRSGRKGRPFYCLKFRTMYHRPQMVFEQTRRQDARVTRIGKFLRKTNLDEMPQFINVLLGDMSLVGPRPHALQHDAQHWSSSSYRKRYEVKPGITGLAQVRGNRGEIQQGFMLDHRIRYDHFYMKRQSMLLDLKICALTLGLMLKGDKNAW